MPKNNDQLIRSLQTARDKSDEADWSRTWWGSEAKKLKRRAESLDDCKIIVCSATGKYATLQFRVLDGRQTIYGVQNFYLRNQWKGESGSGFPPQSSYWYDDAGSDWMCGSFDNETFVRLLDVDGPLYQQATDEQKMLDKEIPIGARRPFTKEEKDTVAECVLPTVRRIDEVWSGSGKTAEDYGYKLGKRKYTSAEDGEANIVGGGQSWETEILGVDRTLKLRMFKALHLLSIHAF